MPPESKSKIMNEETHWDAQKKYTRSPGDGDDGKDEGKTEAGGGQLTKTSTSTSSSSLVRLKKELGLFEAMGVIVGCVVGSGIFVSPKGVLYYSGSVGLALCVWAASGLSSTVGALCFVELGTMIPESGGMCMYLHKAFGPVVSFLYVWVTTLTRNAGGTAVIAITFGQYLVQLMGPTCPIQNPALPVLLAAILVCILTYANCVRVKWVMRLQNLFTVSKLGALAIIVAAGMVYLSLGHTHNLAQPFAGSKWEAGSLSTAFYQCLFSYTGWDYLNLVTEEVKNPNRTLPLAIILSTTIITLIYTLANLAYFAVIPVSEMLASEAVVVTFASKVLGVMAWTMPVFVMISTFGSTNTCIFTQTRLVFVGARQGYFPSACNLVSVENHTPVPAAIVNGVSILVLMLVPNIYLLINFTAFAATGMQFGCICALFWFRYKHPEWPRPFKVWLVLPIAFACCQVFLMVVSVILTPMEVLGAVIIIVAGLPVYYFAIHRKDLAHLCSGPIDKMTLFCQKLFLCALEEKCD